MGTLVCCKTHDEAGSQTQLSVRLLSVDPLVDLEHPIHDSDFLLLVIMNKGFLDGTINILVPII